MAEKPASRENLRQVAITAFRGQLKLIVLLTNQKDYIISCQYIYYKRLKPLLSAGLQRIPG